MNNIAFYWMHLDVPRDNRLLTFFIMPSLFFDLLFIGFPLGALAGAYFFHINKQSFLRTLWILQGTMVFSVFAMLACKPKSSPVEPLEIAKGRELLTSWMSQRGRPPNTKDKKVEQDLKLGYCKHS